MNKRTNDATSAVCYRFSIHNKKYNNNGTTALWTAINISRGGLSHIACDTAADIVNKSKYFDYHFGLQLFSETSDFVTKVQISDIIDHGKIEITL